MQSDPVSYTHLTSLVYYQEQVDAVNPLNSDSDLTLPGWDSSYTRAVSYTHLDVYKRQSLDKMWDIWYIKDNKRTEKQKEKKL